ncbi:MAG: hypothetical protein WBQ86_13180 [Candidatus Binatus sp.]
MKGINQEGANLTPRQEREILDEIRNDRELIGRLRITPQELEALSKCALLGTLTCKQDMLFILRQIREAGHLDHATRVPQPAPPEDKEEDTVADLRRVPVSAGPGVMRDPASLGGIVHRRRPEQWGIFFWGMVVIVALIWNGVIAISHWRDHLLTTMGTPVAQVASSDAFSGLDRFSTLLLFEIGFVGLIATAIYLRSRMRHSRFKVRPVRSLR